MATYNTVAPFVWLVAAAALLVLAAVLAFAPRPTTTRRLIAAFLFVLAAEDASSLPLLFGYQGDLHLGGMVAWFAMSRDLAYLSYGFLAALFWRWPRPASLRSVHGAIMLVGTAWIALAAIAYTFARDAMFQPPYLAPHWSPTQTALGALFAPRDNATSLVVLAMALSAYFRVDRTSPRERRIATLAIPALAPMVWTYAPGYIAATLAGALGLISYGVRDAMGPMDAPLAIVVGVATLVCGYVAPPALALLWWVRERSLLGLGLVLYGMLHAVLFFVLISGIFHEIVVDFWAIQHVFTVALLGYAVARHQAFGIERMPRWAAYAIPTAAGLAACLSIDVIVVYLAEFSTLATTMGILASLLVGGAVTIALLPRDRLAEITVQAGGADDTTRRLAPYRAALTREITAGARGAELASRLEPLRASLGVSDREHALLEWALVDPAPAGSAIERAPDALFLRRYRVGPILGEGGAGTTRLARDEKVGRDVVLKTYRARGPDGLDAMLREARALGGVRHPHVAILYDVEQVGDEGILVMEHIEGGSLKERLARGPLSSRELARLGDELLSALAAVHAAGLVHRDVKPSNVLLTREGNVKLADFGIARVPSLETTVGADAPAVGTVRYMSPEQARGRRARAASDLYAAALTLYEARSGVAYFAPLPNEGAVELQLRIAAAGAFDRAVDPPSLAAWFRKALAPDPAERFRSAAEAREAWERAIAGGA